MILKKLEISGFKSFAKPIVIEFNTPLTAIVGPNGSGKSNIVDALRWVLGEQSARMLRGNKMADIIFSGSKTHKPLNKASVYLHLDNSDRALQVNSNEVVIGRRVNKEGESDYLLNGNICRLKDIKRLLLDTGLGKDLYSIVGQGKIDSIINSKPDKLRELFEEAAGTSSYKVRKQEAEKRLGKTGLNLQRIKDLIKELKNQLRPLKREAEKAKKHENFRKKLEELEVSLLLDKWEKNMAELSSVEINKEFLQEKLEYIQKEFYKLEAEINNNNILIHNKKEKITQMRETLFKLKSYRDELKNKITLYGERENNIIDDIKGIHNWKKNAEKEEHKIKKNIANIEDELNYLKNNRQVLNSKMQEENIEMVQYIKNIKNKKDELSLVQDEILNEKGNINNRKYEIKKLEERINFVGEKKSDLLKEQKESIHQLNIRKKDREKVEKELKSITACKQELATENEKLKVRRENEIKILNKTKDELKTISNKFQHQTLRLNVLREMDDSYDGYYYGVKNALKADNKFPGIKGVVASLIKVKKDYIEAVETALGGKMQNLVVDSDRVAANIIKYLKKNNLGHATFLPVNLIKGKKIIIKNNEIKSISGFIGIAADFVENEDYLQGVVDYLLGNIIIASNIDSAINITRKIASKYTIVTLDGEIIRPGGAMSGGSKNKRNKSLLSRSREKNSLKKSINKLQKDVSIKQKEIRKVEIKNTKLKVQINKNSEKRHNMELDESSINADLKAIRNDIGKLKEKVENNEGKLNTFKQESTELQRRKKKLEDENSQKVPDRKNEKNIINEIKKSINQLEENRKNKAKKITDIKVKIATEGQKIESYIKEKKKLEQEVSDYEYKYSQNSNQMKNKKEKLANLNSKLKDVKIDLSAYKDKIKQIDKDIKNINKLVTIKEEIKINLANKKVDMEENIENIKEQLHKIDLKLSRLQNRCNRSSERLAEAYKIDPEEDNNVNRIKISSYKVAEKKINEFKKTINSIGVVNRGAKKEYEKLKARVDYLISQKKDLIKARNSINKIITEIEDTMGKLFYKSYKDVKKQFGNIFTELFNGGKARLSLSDENDLLNTGVEISAQPPGKKLKKLSLMSGGEKALTAIALVFAFLNVNPSPFYILDEIDAPLDDANVIRFGKFITEYAKFAQFIIITHRKYMMTKAGTIYGVTMQDKGISRLVSLNMTKQGGKIYGYI